MKKFYILNLICAVCTFGYLQAQDIHFSQFYETPLYRNPALAGIVKGDVRVQTVYRNQWNSISAAYKTASLNAELKMPIGNADDFLTLGLQAFYDKAGTIAFTTTHLLPAVNYHKSISENRNTYLSVGFMGGLVQRRFDRSKMTTNSNYEGLGDGESFNQTQFSYLDGSAGISLNSDFGNSVDNSFVIGLAYHHFNKPRNSFYENANITLDPKWVLSAGLKFNVDDYSYITVLADHSRQSTYQETMAGAMYGLKVGHELDNPDYTFHAGAFLRWNDAIIPTFKMDYHPYSIGLSYDVNISKLKTSSAGRGGFELSLSYVGFLDRDNSSANAVKCPQF